MTSLPSKLRHTPFAALARYVSESVSGVFDVAGRPPGRILIAPRNNVVSMLVKVHDNAPGPTVRDLANLDYGLVDDAGAMWHRLDVIYGQNLAEVYAVLCAILDRVQLDNEPYGQAVESVLTGLSDILSGRGELSREQQIGLFGELLVLLALGRSTTRSAALQAWRGPKREEHDFGLATVDLEVKTTTAEQRSHWISSFTQLVPSPKRGLYLLSVQITSAGNESGLSLAELVDRARKAFGPQLPNFEKSLEASGYSERHSDLYQTRWSLRSTPLFYLVDSVFPALTSERVSASVPNADHLKDVQYRLELDGLSSAPPLFPVEL